MKTFASALLLLALAVSPAFAGPLENAISSFESATLGATTPVENLTLKQGHMTFTLASGTAVPVLVGGGEQIGLFFLGKGSYTYVTNDPTEATIVRTNVKRGTDLPLGETPQGLTISDSFEQLLFLYPGGPLPQLSGSSITVDEKWKEHREFFSRDMSAPLSHLYAMKKVDAHPGALVMAQIRGGKESALYFYDDVVRNSESLFKLRSAGGGAPAYFRKKLFRVTLSDQLINKDRKKFAVQNFLLTNVDLDLTASDKKDAHYTVVETVTPMNRARKIYRFDLYNDEYVDLNDVRTYHVKSVTDAAGKPLEFSHRNDEILVALPTAVAVGNTATMKFEVEGDFLHHPSNDSYWELGVKPWFPQPEFGEQYYTFHGVTRIKKPWIALSPGVTIRREEEGDYNVVESKIEQPVQFASILGGKYFFGETTRDGLTVRVASYAQNDQMAFKKLGNLAHQMIDYMELFLGPFPFTEFNIIEKNQYGYGQAPPATMFITKEAFNPHDDLISQANSKFMNHVFAHEIAHQYWAHVVKMPSPEEQWLTESFAEYTAGLVMKKHKGQRYFDGQVKIWRDRAESATESATIPMANRLFGAGDGMVSGQNRQALVYFKGAYLLSQIHKEIGDDQFLTFLKSYQKTFRWKYGTTEHVAGMLQFVTKKDFNPFFEANFWGTGLPPAK